MSEASASGPSVFEHVEGIASLGSLEKALLVLLDNDLRQAGTGLTLWQISQRLSNAGLGNPNRHDLEKKLDKSDLTLKDDGKYRLRFGARDKLLSKYPALNDERPRIFDPKNGYIPSSVWSGTRGYIEKVGLQLNGSYESNYFDAAAVMLRRLAETLVIEAFEKLNRSGDIQDTSGNYLPLADLVNVATGSGGLALGRDAKRGLNEVKQLGDKSAHNRRFNAVQADLNRVRNDARALIDELIAIAALRTKGN